MEIPVDVGDGCGTQKSNFILIFSTVGWLQERRGQKVLITLALVSKLRSSVPASVTRGKREGSRRGCYCHSASASYFEGHNVNLVLVRFLILFF